MKQLNFPTLRNHLFELGTVADRLIVMLGQFSDLFKGLRENEPNPSAQQRDFFIEDNCESQFLSSRFLREWREAGKL